MFLLVFKTRLVYNLLNNLQAEEVHSIFYTIGGTMGVNDFEGSVCLNKLYDTWLVYRLFEGSLIPIGTYSYLEQAIEVFLEKIIIDDDKRIRICDEIFNNNKRNTKNL